MQAKPRLHAAPATFASLALVLALAVVGVVVLGGGKAGAVQQVSCGDTITADTTLHHNLVNCPNNGIIIGADNITLDLNYHTIDGDGTPFAGCAQPICDSGVVDDGHDGVAMVHGQVREFSFGLNLGPARHARVLGVSTAKSRFTGILCFKCVRSVVRNSSGNRSIAGEDAAGMSLFASHHNRIVHNSFRRNAHFAILVLGSGGDKSTNNLIERNRFSRNGDEAILCGCEGFHVSHNRFVRNGGGITLGGGSRNVIIGNYVSGGRDGIRIEKGHDDLVADNVVSHVRRAGIRLGIPHPFLGGAHNTVRGNLVKGSRVDGFLVNAKDDHSLLRHNTARGAGDDGFDIQSRSAKLTSNRAVRNHDLGIEAVPGVIDGGGNEASGNGDLRQCINIACS